MRVPVQNVPVGPEEAGQKLLQYLVRRLSGQAPQSLILRFIRTGQVRVNGGRAKPFDRLPLGAVVRIPPFEAEEPGSMRPEIRPETASAASRAAAAPGRAPFPVIFEDQELLVIEKPAGLPTHPGSGWTDSVQTRLAAFYAGAAFAPTPAHRLDRDTSGLLAVAKTYACLRHLQEAFQDKTAGKSYLAWVRGAFDLCAPGRTARLEDKLEKKGRGGREKVEAGSGKRAVTLASPIRIKSAESLVSLDIQTGRTHQIRVQLASRGFPIVGDAKYGGGKGPMHLHAYRLRIDGKTFVSLPGWTGRFDVADMPGLTESELR